MNHKNSSQGRPAQTYAESKDTVVHAVCDQKALQTWNKRCPGKWSSNLSIGFTSSQTSIDGLIHVSTGSNCD